MNRETEADNRIAKKYLRQYAEPEAAALEGLVDQGPWANVLVIPARNETSGLLRPPPPCDGRSLMILVINESVSSSHVVSSGNRALAASVHERFEPLWQSGRKFSGFELNLLRDDSASRDLLVVDRFGKGRKLPAKGGVGHARKIGADLAASLIHRGYVGADWIHCTDADVRLPETYFTCSTADQYLAPQVAALVYPFRHQPKHHGSEHQDVILATQLYELSLRYYVAGMRFANSPYAFHTIGSTIAVKAAHYAKVRGFPKREAAEDFYLLNKLAKVGSVIELGASPGCEPLEIEARRSDRVPFGTGAAVNRITCLADPVSTFLFYDPEVFVLLQQWLQSWPAIWRSRNHELSDRILTGHEGAHDPRGQEPSLLACLKDIGAERALAHAFRQSRDFDQFTRQLHTWFDAFRSLKLIHALRDHHLPSVSYAGLGANQIFCRLLAQDPDLLGIYEPLRNKVLK